MRKLTTSTGAKVTAVLLLVIMAGLCAVSTIGSVFVAESGLAGNSQIEEPENLTGYQQSIFWGQMEALQTEGAAEAILYGTYKDQLPAYAGYWNVIQEQGGYYGFGERMGNMKLQFWDYSDGSVTYTEEGIPINSRENSEAAAAAAETGGAGAPGASDADRQFYTQAPEVSSLAAMGEDLTRDAERYIGHAAYYASEILEDGTEVQTPGYGMELMKVRYLREGLEMSAGSGRQLMYMENGSICTGESTDRISTTGATWLFLYRNGLVAAASVADPMQYADTFWLLSLCFKIFKPFGSSLIPIACISGILTLVLFFWLLMAAGRRPAGYEETDGAYPAGPDGAAAAAAEAKGEAPGVSRADVTVEEDSQMARCDAKTLPKGFVIRKRWPESIPLDLFFMGTFLLCMLPLVLAAVGTSFNGIRQIGISSMWVIIVTTAVLIAGAAALVTEFFMSLSVQVKLGKWWRNSLIWKVCAWFVRLIKKILKKVFGPLASAVGSQAGDVLRSIGIQWKLCLGAAAALIFNVIAGYFGFYDGGWLVLGFFVDAGILFLVLVTGLMLRRLEKSGQNLASGRLEEKVDTTKLFGSFRRHGENLNSISDGMALAIEQRMRSEHLKTELITNVSHDIKTPLTSIINYVDLLGKEELEEKPAEYVDVLKRQSGRLKKLTEDLIEASKAATGNISIELGNVDIREAVNQAAGEYAERFEAAGLVPVITAPDRPVTAQADGRLLWRVLDNLLSNVCKYSMNGTRVYITVDDGLGAAGQPGLNSRSPYPAENRIRISVKNISRECLNIPAEELMERFVRGDASRTSATEGSGLGLNIAKSLTELQGGTFALTVDGDLFKAEVTLRK